VAALCVVLTCTVVAACSSDDGSGDEAADTKSDNTPDGGASDDGGADKDTATPQDTAGGGDVGCSSATDCKQPTNPCLVAVCDPGFGCKLDAREDGTKCDDGDKCTTDEACSVGTCTAADSKQCDDDNACTGDKCDPATGQCVHQSKLDGVHCDDGNPCTAEPDTCKQGKCTGGADQCQCESDADCAKLDDSDPCNGKLTCVKTADSASCKVDPKSVIVCPTDKDTTCMKSRCQTADGSCKVLPVKGLVGCNDGNVCTSGDQCKAGVCKGSYFCECEKNADCAKQEDGNLCNGTLICNASHKCAVDPATVVDGKCSGKVVKTCHVDTCNPKTGKCEAMPMLDGNTCPSADKCFDVGTCKAGACVPGKKLCACTADADCPDNNDLCDGVPVCDHGANKCVVNPASAVTCTEADGNVCTLPSCDKKTGKCGENAGPDGAKCDDGDACSVGEQCKAGACGLSKPATDCDDLDVCTTDACNPKTGGCEHKAIAGCQQPAPIPQGVTGLFDWLSKGVYKVAYKSESKSVLSGAHGLSRGWFSPTLFKSLKAGSGSHPKGSAAVKELLQADGKALRGWAVHVKTAADGAGGKGWYSYAVVGLSGTATPTANSHGDAACGSCHAKGKDHVLTKWPLP